MNDITIQNIFDIGNTALADVKMIPLTKGQLALVDAKNYAWLNQWKWHAVESTVSGKFYAIRTVGSSKKKNKKIVRMHRFITSAPDGWDVDHIDGDRLNNLEKNLRVCTRSQNNGNSIKGKNKSSKYKGVTWNADRNKWSARIHRNNKTCFLGRFTSEHAAARAYNEAAKEYFGEFARLNIL